MHLPGQPLRTRGTAGAARTEILVTASRARQPSATALSDLASRRSSLDAQVILARTGYTGEDGFEIFAEPDDAGRIWDAILEAGEPLGAGPTGLGARDTLRLEKQFRLYGQDMDEGVSALEAGLGWVVKLAKGDFVGRDALLAQRAAGIPRATLGLKILGDGKTIPRHGCPVLDEDGQEVGVVTSGTISPTLSVGIALARVQSRAAEKDELSIRVRGRDARAVRVKKSFV